MLAIRMQRTGRKGHAMFRVIVQDSRRTPTSGKVVAQIGSYDPHAKTVALDKEKASFYLDHGAQPSGRVVILLKKEGVKLPKWVNDPTKKDGTVRNPDKRRSTRPDEPAEEAPAAEAEAAETPEASADGDTAEQPAEASDSAESTDTEAPAGDKKEDSGDEAAPDNSEDAVSEADAGSDEPAPEEPTNSDATEDSNEDEDSSSDTEEKEAE